MSGSQPILDHLSELFKEKEISLNGKSGSPMHLFQKNAFAKLQSVDFPTRKHEDWKYTPIQKILTPKYALPGNAGEQSFENMADLDTYVIHISNGRFDAHLNDHSLVTKGIKLVSADTAFLASEWKETFYEKFEQHKASSNQAFDYLNLSFTTNGLFIDIPSGLHLDKPIEFRISHSDTKVSFSHPLLFIRFGRESNVTIFERFEEVKGISNSPESFINSLFFYHLDKNAKVSHIKWQNLGPDQHLVYKLKVTQQRDSHFSTLAFDYGGQIIRNNVEVDMIDTNTYTSLQAGFIAKGKQSMDHQTLINHRIHHCESHELYKGILDGQASAAFNGKVFVHKDAQKTNAYQQNDTLVLSPNAVMNSKPQLEIFADDVKCSHGATIGQMDEQALFYLRSRGITKEQATYMLKAAFLETVFQQIPIEQIRQYITSGMSIDA